METQLNPCLALKSFVDYWDDWHNEWYINASSKPPKLTPIKGWPIPASNKENDIWRFFPEPYWGNSSPTELTAVFLNLNPGEGGDVQDIKISRKDPIATYNAKYQIYSKTVDILINNPYFPTTDWFIKKRVHWINCLLHHLKRGNGKTINNLIAGELVPWHTKHVNEIKKYTDENIVLIEKNCVQPLADISQCALFEGVVFAKGAGVVNVLTKISTKKACYTTIEKFSIHVFEFNGAIFIVFVGGRNMNLPNLNKRYTSSISNKPYNVLDIINGCINKIYV